MAKVLLSRRHALRAAGISVGLPLLEAMTDGRGRIFYGRSFAATPPVRFFTVYHGNGVRVSNFFPSTPGPLTPGALTTSLRPLGPMAGQPDILPYLNVVAGLYHGRVLIAGHDRNNTFVGRSDGNSHNDRGAIPLGPSVEQVPAQSDLGAKTKFRSISLRAADEGVMSYGNGGKAMPPIIESKVAFDTLFSGTPAAAGPSPEVTRLAAQRKSVLDFVREDAADLQKRLGASDKQRVQDHLDAIQELSKQVAETSNAAPTAGCTAPERPASFPGRYTTSDVKNPVMTKILVTALRCDLVRYGSYILSGGQDRFPSIGSNGGDHDLSHNAGDDTIAQRTAAKMTYFAAMLRQMANVREGDKTLLDSMVIVMSSEVADGRRHDKENLPVLTAGRGGGMKAGRFVKAPSRTPLNNLFVSLLNHAGVPTTTFGTDGSGPLSGF
jgi:hypothetical protein